MDLDRARGILVGTPADDLEDAARSPRIDLAVLAVYADVLDQLEVVAPGCVLPLIVYVRPVVRLQRE